MWATVFDGIDCPSDVEESDLNIIEPDEFACTRGKFF
jgi:hypothetical protein